MEKRIFLDIEDAGNGCLGNLDKNQQIVFAGKSINSLTDRDSHQAVYKILAETFGIHFCQGNTVQDFHFYPIPLIEIFATDGQGGCFASVGGGGTLDDWDYFPIVYISPQQEITYLAKGMRSFFSLSIYFPYWKAYLAKPTADTLKQLEQAYQFLHPALESHRKLMAMLLCLTKSEELLHNLRIHSLPVTLYPSRQAAESQNYFLTLKGNFVSQKAADYKKAVPG